MVPCAPFQFILSPLATKEFCTPFNKVPPITLQRASYEQCSVAHASRVIRYEDPELKINFAQIERTLLRNFIPHQFMEDIGHLPPPVWRDEGGTPGMRRSPLAHGELGEKTPPFGGIERM